MRFAGYILLIIALVAISVFVVVLNYTGVETERVAARNNVVFN